MNETVNSISWDAPEHNHIEKTNDWYWILGIIAISGAVTSMIFNNALFGIVIILSAFSMFIFSHHKPKMLHF